MNDIGFHRVAGGVVVVAVLRHVKAVQRLERRNDRSAEDPGAPELREVGLGHGLLVIASIKNGGTVLAPAVVPLPVQLSRIVGDRKKDF